MKAIAINGSARKGGNTEALLRKCLGVLEEAGIAGELVGLHDKTIKPCRACNVCFKNKDLKCSTGDDDFAGIFEKMCGADIIILGSPVYFGNMSALCKAFLDRCVAFRKGGFVLRDKVGGVLAVGGGRNGGQELIIRSIQTALMCQDMVIVGDGKPSAKIGATLWNQKDSIAEDEFGTATAKGLGRRVAELAQKMG